MTDASPSSACAAAANEEVEAGSQPQQQQQEKEEGEQQQQHVDGARTLPTLGPDGWARYPSVTERYYSKHVMSNHQSLHQHSNGCARPTPPCTSSLASHCMLATGAHRASVLVLGRICVLGVAASHPMLQPPLRITGVAFRSHDSKNLMDTAVRGKKKAGAVFVTPRDMVCTVTVSDGSEVVLYACVRASVVEVNQRLIERPELLGSPEGYVAILMPKLEEKKTMIDACLEFDKQSPLDALSTNEKRRLEGKPVRTSKKKARHMAPCHDFQRTGSCRYGDRCRFAHGEQAAGVGPPAAATAVGSVAGGSNMVPEDDAPAAGEETTDMKDEPTAKGEPTATVEPAAGSAQSGPADGS